MPLRDDIMYDVTHPSFFTLFFGISPFLPFFCGSASDGNHSGRALLSPWNSNWPLQTFVSLVTWFFSPFFFSSLSHAPYERKSRC